MQNKSPKVSIILPCYNGADMLGRAIESVIEQSYKDWELIIVNDCSTDNTLAIAQGFANTDKRIKVFSNEVNSKLPASLNNGFKEAKGKYWTWTSDDNILLPNFLEEFVTYLDAHPEIGFAVGGEHFIDASGNIIETNFPPEDIQSRMSLNNYVGACFMYRKEAALKVGEYRKDLFLVEDYEYWIRLSGVTQMGTIQKILYKYCMHAKSLTATRQKEIQERLVRMRLMYKEQVEVQLKDSTKLLVLFYYRIVDALKGSEKWKYIFEFTKKQPFYFGIKYFFVHIPHKLIKK